MRKSPYVSRLLPLHQWKKATVNCARDITMNLMNLKLFVRADCATNNFKFNLLSLCHAHNLQLPFTTDEEAAASKRMVIYAFSAQINLICRFTSAQH